MKDLDNGDDNIFVWDVFTIVGYDPCAKIDDMLIGVFTMTGYDPRVDIDNDDMLVGDLLPSNYLIQRDILYSSKLRASVACCSDEIKLA